MVNRGTMSAFVVEHKTRKMIINHILAHPGVSFGIIKRVLALTDSTLRYHLNYLEGRNEIKSTIEGKNKCYYPVHKFIFEPKSESDLKTHRLSNTQERLLNTIQRYPGINQKDLIIRSGFKRITVSHNLKKLIDFGVVRKEPNGRHVCYHYITDTELREKIIKRLINDEIDEQTFLVLKRKLE